MAQRRRNRFSSLERQYRESGGQAAPGSRLAGYIDYKRGINKVNVENRPSAALLQRLGHSIIPFGISPGATPADSQKYIIAITVWSDNGRRLLALSDNDLGYFAMGQGDDNDLFFPAMMKVFVRSPTATRKTPISGVTKKEYSRKLGHSYSIPFGRTLSDLPAPGPGQAANTTIADADEEEVRIGLALQIKGANSAQLVVGSVSYEPEIFRTGRPNPIERPADSPGNPALPT